MIIAFAMLCDPVLCHRRRRVVHFNVTEHLTAEWTAQARRVGIDAFPGDEVLSRSTDSYATPNGM